MFQVFRLKVHLSAENETYNRQNIRLETTTRK